MAKSRRLSVSVTAPPGASRTWASAFGDGQVFARGPLPRAAPGLEDRTGAGMAHPPRGLGGGQTRLDEDSQPEDLVAARGEQGDVRISQDDQGADDGSVGPQPHCEGLQTVRRLVGEGLETPGRDGDRSDEAGVAGRARDLRGGGQRQHVATTHVAAEPCGAQQRCGPNGLPHVGDEIEGDGDEPGGRARGVEDPGELLTRSMLVSPIANPTKQIRDPQPGVHRLALWVVRISRHVLVIRPWFSTCWASARPGAAG